MISLLVIFFTLEVSTQFAMRRRPCTQMVTRTVPEWRSLYQLVGERCMEKQYAALDLLSHHGAHTRPNSPGFQGCRPQNSASQWYYPMIYAVALYSSLFAGMYPTPTCLSLFCRLRSQSLFRITPSRVHRIHTHHHVIIRLYLSHVYSAHGVQCTLDVTPFTSGCSRSRTFVSGLD